ncbi:MAG: TolC family protein [Pseudomonadota bacterium]|nr:MAG: TolC family protein [Pseudomonadota bacterium]
MQSANRARMSGRAAVAAMTVAIALMVPLWVAAQSGQSSPEGTLTLDEAVATAMQNNLELHAARQEILTARARLEHASRWAPSNPRISVKQRRRNPPGPGGTSTDFGVELSQELWIGGQRGLNRSGRQSEVESARAMIQFLELTVAARTRRAFLDLIVARESVETAQRAVTVTEEIQQTTLSRKEAGEATRIEVNSAAIGVGRARSALAEARADANGARARLRELMADKVPEDIELSGDFNLRALDLPPRSELLNRVVGHRGDLAAAAADIAAAESDLALSKRQLIPNLTVFGFYEQEEEEDITGVGVSMPLPVLHRYGGERKEAQADLRKAQIERDALLLEVRIGLDRAIEDYRVAKSRIEAVSEQVLASAEDNVRLTYEAFRAGEVGITAVSSAQEALLQARRAYLEARRAFIRAATDLERTSGGLLVVHGRPAEAETSPEDEINEKES